MSFALLLVKNGSTVFTIGTKTPFVSPEYSYEFDDQQPPMITAIVTKWTVQGIIFGASEAAVATAWAAIKAALETSATYPDGAKFVRGGSTTVDEISSSAGFLDFKVEHLSSPRHERQWRGRMEFTLVISGKKRILASITTNGGAGTTSTGGPTGNIAKLTMTQEYAYDEAGLLTRTLAGELEVLSGSAEAAARTLGLDLPGATFGYVTAGPEGVDVTIQDRGDNHASFKSIVRERGGALPANVAPSYSVTVTTSEAAGVVTTTTEITAMGPGAETAVRTHGPAGPVEQKVIVADAWGRTARATYVQRAPSTDSTQITKTHRISTSGGGQPVRWSSRTGGRLPVRHVLPRVPVEISEEIHVEVVGAVEQVEFKFPPPIVAPGVLEDTSGLQMIGPERSVQGKDVFSSRWVMTIRRIYRAAAIDLAWAAIARAALAGVTETKGLTTPADEVTRQAGA